MACSSGSTVNDEILGSKVRKDAVNDSDFEGMSSSEEEVLDLQFEDSSRQVLLCFLGVNCICILLDVFAFGGPPAVFMI